MECPNCKNPIEIPMCAEHNVSAYRKPLVTKVTCCGQFINLNVKTVLYATEYKGTSPIDDWVMKRMKMKIKKKMKNAKQCVKNNEKKICFKKGGIPLKKFLIDSKIPTLNTRTDWYGNVE